MGSQNFVVFVYNNTCLCLLQIGYAAHLAGAIAGLLVGINVLRNLEIKSWERKVWWASIIMYTALMLAAIIWNAAFPSYFLPSK
jgi:rhomboid-related protein 1/2/3